MFNSKTEVESTIEFDLIKRIADDNHQAFFVYNFNQSSFQHVNSWSKKLLRLSMESINSNSSILLSVVHPEDKQFVYDAFNTFKENLNKKKLSFRIISRDQTIKWVSISAHMILDNMGKPERIIVLGDDITLAKQYE